MIVENKQIMEKMKHNVVVTGGSEGIGLGIAKQFLQQGSKVLIIGRSQEKLHKAKKNLSTIAHSTIETLAADLTKTKNLKNIAKEIIELFPYIDVLVNNAGTGQFLPFEKMDEESLDLHLDLNVKAPYLLTKHLLPSLTTQKGNVINISSYFANRMLPGRNSTAYSLTKGAINSFTKSLAFELGKTGIRINAIAPGSIKTNLFADYFNSLSEESKLDFQEMIKQIYPLQKIGEVEDVAEMAVFLASDKAKWITGNIIPVDGGLTTN